MSETTNRLLSQLDEQKYLLITGVAMLFTGFGLFFYQIITIKSPIEFVATFKHILYPDNPLFFLILGLGLLSFRYFLKVVDKKENVEVE